MSLLSNNIEIFETSDGSLGLYNKEVNDVYHSKFGAYSESLDKFVIPADINSFAKNNDKLKILDICYGIGYNSKSAIKVAMEVNPNINIHIDALEIDQEVILLSGLLNNSNYDKGICENILNLIIGQREKFDFVINQSFIDKYKAHCAQNAFKTFKEIYDLTASPTIDKKRFLHNIYYHSVSDRNKKAANASIFNHFIINWYVEDARISIKSLEPNYDFIFLDAFTPKLVPSLWSYDFFKVLYKLLNDNGRLLTYTSAVNVRSAMLAVGFIVGKNLDKDGKSIGTVACKKPYDKMIPLNEYEQGLIKTKAGLFYKDPNLSLTDLDIIKNLENDKKNSDRESSSQYMKRKGAK